MLLPDFAEDPVKWREGAPIYVDAAHGQIIFYVRRWGPAESIEARKKIIRAIYGPLHSASDVETETVHAHWLAEYGVTDWENIDSENTAYTQELAREVFLQPEHFYSLNQYLINQALNFENYLFDEAKEILENAKKF
jgi:hypothetical protein